MVTAGANNDQRIFGQVLSRKTRPTRARRGQNAIVMNPSDFHNLVDLHRLDKLGLRRR